MGIVLTLIQGLVGLAFAAAGGMKASQSKDAILAMGDNMAWAKDFDANQIRLIGIAELAGGLGLLATLFLRQDIMLLLGGIAGICLAILMGGAIYTHVRRNDPMPSNVAPAVLGILALVASYNLLV